MSAKGVFAAGDIGMPIKAMNAWLTSGGRAAAGPASQLETEAQQEGQFDDGFWSFGRHQFSRTDGQSSLKYGSMHGVMSRTEGRAQKRCRNKEFVMISPGHVPGIDLRGKDLTFLLSHQEIRHLLYKCLQLGLFFLETFIGNPAAFGYRDFVRL